MTDSEGVSSEQERQTPGTVARVEEEDDDSPLPVKRMVEMMAVSMSRRSGFHPIFDKLTGGHVTKFLDHAHEDNKNEYELNRSNRWFRLVYVLLGMGLFLFLVVYLGQDNSDLLADIIKIAAAFLGGLGGGYGMKAHLDSRRR